MIIFNLLKPQDIEVRIATVKDGRAKLLLYQNSRTTMDALDATVGIMNWQMDYFVCGGQTYGRLSIYDEEKHQWVSKADTGEESNIAEKKGQSSDILKRCAVRFGFARELYTAPTIVVPIDDKHTSFRVESISYSDNREIAQLTIVDRSGKVVFEWSKDAQYQKEGDALEKHQETAIGILTAFCKEKAKDKEVDRGELERFFNFYKIKCDTWKNKFDAPKLFDRWITR